MNTTPRTVYRFEFVHRVDIDEVEQTLALSILAVGCLHGEAAVGEALREVTPHGAGLSARAACRVGARGLARPVRPSPGPG